MAKKNPLAKKTQVEIGLIGFGYWGPNLARNFAAQENCRLKYVVDLNPQRLATVKKLYPAVITTDRAQEVINDPEIDAVVIASPVASHYPLAKKALLQGKHVLIEKPLTRFSAQAKELIALAKKKKLVLMVDHTFLYTGAVRRIKALIESGEIGQIHYFDSTRINLGLFQHDINVVWDLAPHDLSILRYLVKEKPYSVSAHGVAHTSSRMENLAYITLNYQSDLIAHFTLSWASPVKIRKTLIGGSKKMVVYDDLEPTEKVRIYDTGFSERESAKLLVDYRVGDIYIPKIPQGEALNELAKDFLTAVTTGRPPLSDGAFGLEIVQILEAAEKSIKLKGKEVRLK
jgi:predicted dehydrogenase